MLDLTADSADYVRWLDQKERDHMKRHNVSATFLLTLPLAMRDQLADWARSEARTLDEQIAYLLSRALAEAGRS